jgi:hypothetical protein
MPGSVALIAFFVLTTLATKWVLLRLVRMSSPASAQMVSIGAGMWLALTAVLAARGMLAFGPMPPRVMLVVGVAVAITLALAFSHFGARLAFGTPMTLLVGYQAFRIPVEIFLDWGYREGMVPVQMTFEGRNFDVISGITAAIAALLARNGKLTNRLAMAWNILGLALLANIVGVAILSMPTPFRVFSDGIPNTFVTRLPYIWLPAFLVPAALFGHLLVFRRLANR